MIALTAAAVFAAAAQAAEPVVRVQAPEPIVRTQVVESVVRVKAKLTAFDGQVMSLQVLFSPTGEMKTGDAFNVSILPGTRYVSWDKSSLAAIKPSDYAGAAVAEGRDGHLTAQEVYLYASDLRGTGEGRFPESDRLMVNGTVSAVQPPDKDQKNGKLTLHYRGATLTGLGRGKTLCEGRALPPAYASALACEGDAVVDVPPGAPVAALTVGDKSLLVVGSTLTVAMTKDGDENVTPGVIVEKSVVVEKPETVEKPQSNP